MGGSISFIDARSAPAGSALVQSPLLASSYTMRPEPGMLLMFPGTLKHWVHPNNSPEERVTVAFNVFLNRANKA